MPNSDPLGYKLEFANVPFVGDTSRVVRMKFDANSPDDPGPSAPKKHQPCVDLIDEINRLIPPSLFRDQVPPADYPGRTLGALAALSYQAEHMLEEVRIGQWYYPCTASQWSIFRGLATSSMVAAMLAATGGTSASTFTMKCLIGETAVAESDYEISTQMYMLPARPLAEHGGSFDGLFLVTLVDERFYWKDRPVSLTVTESTTWGDLIDEIASVLGVSITYDVAAAAGKPTQDSQLWTRGESASRLLDVIAYNLTATCVRKMGGSYQLLTTAQSLAVVNSNRPRPDLVARVAGGDLYYSGNQLPTGSLIKQKNSVTPRRIDVHFPKYVTGDDPVPHFYNPRTAPPTPSLWFQESYGDTYVIEVPISSGGPYVSGLQGTGISVLRSTSKALYGSELDAAEDASPDNVSGLLSLASFLATDLYESLATTSLDEVYPGSFNWEPEGINDIVWTYSERVRMANTRIFRSEWNNWPRDFQNSVPSSGVINPRGVGGPLLALTVRDDRASGAFGLLSAPLNSGSFGTVTLGGSGLPVSGYWRGQLSGETIYLGQTGTSGSYDVVYRGIDGSTGQSHVSGSRIALEAPSVQYGVNLLTARGAMQAIPGEWTEGGIIEAGLDVKPGGINRYYLSSGFIHSGDINSGNLTIINWNLTFYSGYIIYPPIYISGPLTSNLISGGGVPKIALAMTDDVYIRGITQGQEGRILYLLNLGTGKVTLGDQQGPVVNGIPTSILLPVPNVGAGASGYASGYTIWPRNGVILEYVSGLWRFDHPTFAGGDHGSTGFNTLGPPVTYALQHLRAGSGLGYRDNNDGSANMYVQPIFQMSGSTGGTGVSGDVISLASTYDITGNAVWEDTGLTATLPAGGSRYMLTASVNGYVNMADASTTPVVYARLKTASGTVMNSVAVLHHSFTGVTAGGLLGTGVVQAMYTASISGEIIVLQAARQSGGSYINSRILATVDGNPVTFPNAAGTTLAWLKLT